MTSETRIQHTPGPWKRIDLDGETYINPERDSGEYALIARLASGPVEANARLIAAAPDLLAALEALLRNRYDRDAKAAYQPEWDQASRAIRRARGED